MTTLVTDKQAQEKARRKLPSMGWDRLVKLATEEDIREFHNGGTRRRYLVGLGIYVSYRSSRSSVHELATTFLKWCKGYVKDGIMYDVDGNVLSTKLKEEGASEDGVLI